MSDVPLGAMLSGGLDSSLVVALMARNMSEPVKTFSVGSPRRARATSSPTPASSPSTFGTDHHELELSFATQTVDLAELVWHLDEPLADLSSLGFLALSELAAKHVTVALSGQGADELLGGYRKHRAAAIAGAWRRLPRPVGARRDRRLRHGPGGVQRRRRATLAAGDPADAAARDERPDRRRRAATSSYAARSPTSTAARRVQGDRPRPRERVQRRSAAGDALPRRAARARRRHAPLLRPRVDGAFARGARAVPRSRAGRVLRDDPFRSQGATPDDQASSPEGARGLIPDRVLDKKKIGFFSHTLEGWFTAQTGGARWRLPSRRGATVRRVPRSRLCRPAPARSSGWTTGDTAGYSSRSSCSKSGSRPISRARSQRRTPTRDAVTVAA